MKKTDARPSPSAPRRRVLRLRTKLLLSFAVLTAVITLLLINGLYRTGRAIIKENAAVAYLTGLQYSVQVLDKSLSGIEYATFPLLMDAGAKDSLRGYAAGSPYQRYRSDQYLLAQLKNITIQNDDVDSAYLYYAGEGCLIGTDLSHTFGREELASSGWDRLLTDEENIRLGQWVVTPSLREPGERRVSNFKWIRDGSGGLLGVVVVNLRPDLWDKVLGSSDGAFAVLSVDSRGELLCRQDLPADFSLPPEELASREDDGWFDDGPYTVSRTRSDYNGWCYLGVARTADMLGQLRDLQRRVLPLVAAVVLVSMLMMALVTAHIMHPVNVLKNAMSRMGEGDLSVRIQEQRGDDFQILYRGFNSMADNLDRTVQRVYRQELEQKDMSMRILRSQLNAHFLYNTLDTIRWIAVLHRVPEVGELVTHLANYYRVALNQGRDLQPISDCLSLIRSYLKICEAKDDRRIILQSRVPEELLEVCILKNILQPLVENSIQHGMEGPADRPLTITLCCRADREAGTLTITLEDDGAGIQPQRLAQLQEALLQGEAAREHGFALWNLNDQLRTYYGEGYGLWIESEAGSYTRVRLLLPLEHRGGPEAPAGGGEESPPDWKSGMKKRP